MWVLEKAECEICAIEISQEEMSCGRQIVAHFGSDCALQHAISNARGTIDVVNDGRVSIVVMFVNPPDSSGSPDWRGDDSQIVLLCGFMCFSELHYLPGQVLNIRQPSISDITYVTQDVCFQKQDGHKNR